MAKLGCFIPAVTAFGVVMIAAALNHTSTLTDNGPTCQTNWRQCRDNADIVNNWNGMGAARSSCRIEAASRARYGTPEWPSYPFGRYATGTSAKDSGTIWLTETAAKFSNGFGAMRSTTVRCKYDLGGKDVADVLILGN